MMRRYLSMTVQRLSLDMADTRGRMVLLSFLHIEPKAAHGREHGQDKCGDLDYVTMSDFVKARLNGLNLMELLKPYIAPAREAIQRCTVALNLDDEAIGSGTFVSTFGIEVF